MSEAISLSVLSTTSLMQEMLNMYDKNLSVQLSFRLIFYFHF